MKYHGKKFDNNKNQPPSVFVKEHNLFKIKRTVLFCQSFKKSLKV